MKTESTSSAACADSCQCEDQVRDYAYHLYEQSNRAPGRDLENWLEASACLRARIPARESGARLHRHLGENERAVSPAVVSVIATPAAEPIRPVVVAPVHAGVVRGKN
jgi:hypothetical protein